MVPVALFHRCVGIEMLTRNGLGCDFVAGELFEAEVGLSDEREFGNG